MRLALALTLILASASVLNAQAIPGGPTRPPDQPPQQPRGGGGGGGGIGLGVSFKLGKKKKPELPAGPPLEMRDQDMPDHLPNRALFFMTAPAANAARAAKACKLSISQSVPLDQLQTVMIVANTSTGGEAIAVACLAKQPGVDSAQPDYHYQLLGGGGGSRAKGYALHGLKNGNPTPVNGTIVLIDTAVDTAHPNLKSASIGQSYFDVPATPAAHGTAIAELLVGGGTYPGTAPGATLISYAAFAPAGEGQWLSQSSALLKALNATAQLAPYVVNLSFGRPSVDPMMAKALNVLRGKGVCVVAAAGNGSGKPVLFPATHPASLAVTAVDGRMRPYAYASQGKEISVAAWGVDLLAAVPGGRRSVSGTSFATAVVSGNLLRLPECKNNRDPGAMKVKIMAAAQDLGAAGPDPIYGAGLFRIATGK